MTQQNTIVRLETGYNPPKPKVEEARQKVAELLSRVNRHLHEIANTYQDAMDLQKLIESIERKGVRG